MKDVKLRARTCMCLLGYLHLTTRGNNLSVEKEKKSLTDLIIERSVELYGFTPDERSDENLKWMRENGYGVKQMRKRGRERGRRR